MTQKKKIAKVITWIVACASLSVVTFYGVTQTSDVTTLLLCPEPKEFKVVTKYKTPNVQNGINTVDGIVLHHTASRNAYNAICGLCDSHRKHRTSCHVVIDRDGTRYVLAQPKARTMHAGPSMLHGRNNCNKFTIGIELQGNTCLWPLSDAQIKSTIEYIIPLIKKYDIPLENIVSHKQVRNEWLRNHKDRKDIPRKVDISDREYTRFMKCLKAELNKTKA